MDLKYFFDFEKCWNEILGEYKEDEAFDQDMLDDIEDKRIVNFIKNQIPINDEGCEISGDFIIFCFSKEFQTANESNNQNEYSTVYIEFDYTSERFTHYEQEQG
jgi:hypothetical protein